MTDRPHDRPEVSYPADPPTRDARDDSRAWVPWSEIELADEPSQPDARETTEHPSEPDELSKADSPESAARLTGWDASGVVDNADRPDPEAIHLPVDRRTHILDGEPDRLSGGHRHGTDFPDKTEFPQRWNDDMTCAYILDVARNPDIEPRQQNNRRWLCTGGRDGVEIRVIVWPEGKIWTSWPEPGGDGVVHNPPRER